MSLTELDKLILEKIIANHIFAIHEYSISDNTSLIREFIMELYQDYRNIHYGNKFFNHYNMYKPQLTIITELGDIIYFRLGRVSSESYKTLIFSIECKE